MPNNPYHTVLFISALVTILLGIPLFIKAFTKILIHIKKFFVRIYRRIRNLDKIDEYKLKDIESQKKIDKLTSQIAEDNFYPLGERITHDDDPSDCSGY